MSKFYNFVLYQWQIKAYTQTNIQNAVTKTFVTQAEADEILSIPQIY